MAIGKQVLELSAETVTSWQLIQDVMQQAIPASILFLQWVLIDSGSWRLALYKAFGMPAQKEAWKKPREDKILT